MKEVFDRFPVNIGESTGRIERKSFEFNYSLVEVWHQGECIYRTESPSTIIGEVIDQNLNVNLNLNNSIALYFSNHRNMIVEYKFIVKFIYDQIQIKFYCALSFWIP